MHRSTVIAVPFALALAAGLLVSAAYAADKPSVAVSRELEFADSSGVSGKVRSECTLQTRLPQFIKDSATTMTVELVEDIEATTAGRVLKIEIVNVIGKGGGAWSGSKSVSVRGELTENGEVIGTFISSRFSGGGAFGGYKGTCSILGRCVKAMGADIAAWLSNPTMDARLGDA